ncbi:MAG: enoyl-CoA hydratase-related protein [Dehalococcoidales bacterium]|nr:enoyl-CoA hydratase-related protein [Dehalococcoidales bacterium]
MDFKCILLEKKGRIATITLNRPGQLNALSAELMSEFDVALTDVENDRSVRVVIIKGAGRAFSAGYDVAPNTPERKAGKTDIGADRRALHTTVRRWLRVWELPKPVIAQVHGYCIAGGTQLASMCDITIISEDCMVGLPAAGPLGAGLMAAEWCHLVGPKKTKEMFYVIGKMLTGKEAVDIGWANKAVPVEKLESEVNTLALQIADTPLEVLELTKSVVNRYVEMSGFREGVFYGADIDAIGHFIKPVQQFLKLIQERGLKQAKLDWRNEIKD